jgi:arsenite methyltransferase
MASLSRDRWAAWLAERRFGGDPETRQRFLSNLAATQAKVLDRAQFAEGETLLDIGCGEGLIAFGALERAAARAIFSDISTDLLDLCRQAAEEMGVLDRCGFVEASADDLRSIDDAVDVVTTRSVLIYVKAKAAAFGEFARVLRPGGRISLFEPINRFAQRDANTWGGYDLSAVPQAAAKLRRSMTPSSPQTATPCSTSTSATS